MATQTITATDTHSSSIVGSLTVTDLPTFVVSGFPATVTAGQTASITVTAMNNGTVNTAYTGTVHFSSSDLQAVLPSDTQLVGGSGTFSVTLKTAGVQSITAADAANGLIASQSGITINAGPATHFGLTAPATAVAGVAVSVTVTALDAYGNPASFYSGTVTLCTTDPNANMPSDTFYGASYTFQLILKTPGMQTITVWDLEYPALSGLWTIDVT
jgi:hypothetical protein